MQKQDKKTPILKFGDEKTVFDRGRRLLNAPVFLAAGDQIAAVLVEFFHRQAAAAHTSLLRQATASLVKAKAYHDELEAIYHPFVYFTALEKFTNRHIKEYIK